jgi:hypothetical protein
MGAHPVTAQNHTTIDDVLAHANCSLRKDKEDLKRSTALSLTQKVKAPATFWA